MNIKYFPAILLVTMLCSSFDSVTLTTKYNKLDININLNIPNSTTNKLKGTIIITNKSDSSILYSNRVIKIGHDSSWAEPRVDAPASFLIDVSQIILKPKDSIFNKIILRYNSRMVFNKSKLNILTNNKVKLSP